VARGSISRTVNAPQYTAVVMNGMPVVYDRINGYALSHHPSAEEAQRAAAGMNSTPAAAIAAVCALDESQTGPAAEFRRLLRRYGYGWAMETRDAAALVASFRTKEMARKGSIVMVWSSKGLPYYTTPERYSELPITFVQGAGDTFPTAPLAMVGRRFERLEAMPPRKRFELCEDHGLQTGTCAICRPKEPWECDYGTCWANAVTVISGRRTCERCAPAMPYTARRSAA
jgi:hypothetical protein